MRGQVLLEWHQLDAAEQCALQGIQILDELGDQRWRLQSHTLLAGVAYAVYSLLQFFEGRPAWSTIWRALLGYGVFSVLSSVAVAMAIFMLMLAS